MSAMHHQHLAMGAVMEERDGWQLPARFKSVDEELELLRTRAGILDVSSMTKLNVQGIDVVDVLGRLCNGVQFPESRQASPVTLNIGGQTVRATLAKLADDDFLILASIPQSADLFAVIEVACEGCAQVFDLSSTLAAAQITGPGAARFLTGITEFNCSPQAFPDGSCAQTQAADIHATLLRTDVGDLPSYQLFFSRDFGEYMWETLVETAEVHDGAPVGFEAMDRLRGE